MYAPHLCDVRILRIIFNFKKIFPKALTFIPPACKIINVVTQGFTLQAQIAQLVEQRTENPRVGGSIPPLGIHNLLRTAGVVQW